MQGFAGEPLAVELLPLRNFYPAEEYHQDYLKKNPGGYCHIDLKRKPPLRVTPDAHAWAKPADAALRFIPAKDMEKEGYGYLLEQPKPTE